MARKRGEEEVETCSVVGCDRPAHRSLSRKKVESALGVSLRPGGRHVHLCKEHYKEYKKATKKDRELERLGW